jgi:glycosyltransferase involved in cell wall biosynthesis
MYVEKLPLISVVTVSFNAAETIEETIKSVLSQTYRNLEFIIVDGNSSDKTVEIIKKHDGIKWISEPDNGIYDAMNKAVKLCTGGWILFLGADDILNDCLHYVAPQLYNNRLVYGNVEYKSSKNIYDGKFNSVKLITKNIPHQAIFYPSFVFKSYQFNIRYKYFADYHLNLLLWKDTRVEFLHINIIISIYNDSGVSSINRDNAFYDDQLKIFLKCMPVLLSPYILLRKSISYFMSKLSNG